MANIRKFEDLKVWQKAHQPVLMVYKLTSKFPPEEKYGLSSQKRRAVVSVASNIVEGFKRRTADASLEELRYQTLLSKDLGYISEIEYIELIKLEEEVSKMLNSWIKSQKGNSA